MKDRLIFKTTKLKNGIHVYSKPMDLPFATVSIYVPVGHIHNTGKVLPGTAHLLEHIACDRSRLYPKQGQFMKKIELAGGDFNAQTTSILTEYCINVRSDMFEEGFKGLMSHVFDPLITAEDIKHQEGIILSESKIYSKWYPGTNKLDHHVRAKWRTEKMYEHRQRIGNAADLKKMTVAGLLRFHKAYFDPRVYVIIGGTFDEKLVFRELGKITTKKHNLPVKFDQVRWIRRAYHEEKFSAIERYQYRIGSIFAERDLQTRLGIRFIGLLLTNSTHGVLMEWLRSDLGWSYDIDFDFEYLENPYVHNSWDICIPLHTRTQVKHVRKELHGRILAAIADKELVAREVERQKAGLLFAYQTLGSILGAADDMLGVGGRIYTEEEIVEVLDHCKDTSFLKEIYDKHWSPEVTGEFLAVPA